MTKFFKNESTDDEAMSVRNLKKNSLMLNVPMTPSKRNLLSNKISTNVIQ